LIPRNAGEDLYMAFAGMCPYLKDARSCDRTICECAKFTFPDKTTRRELIYGYCGHPTAWKECTFKPIMDRYYDRKYAAECNSEMSRSTAH
jgi:hypothetical protein